jgi:hypothetical protein
MDGVISGFLTEARGPENRRQEEEGAGVLAGNSF